MAGTMRKMAEYLGLVEVDDYIEEEIQESGYENNRGTTAITPAAETGTAVAPTEPRHVTPMQPAPLRIFAIQPNAYNDAKRIGEEFRAGFTVLINLTEMTDQDAKRIIDFTSGLVFGLHGSIEKISMKVFVISPANVHLDAETRQRIAQDGFFNQS